MKANHSVAATAKALSTRTTRTLEQPLAYGIADVATALGTGTTTVWEAIRRHELAAVRLRGRTLVTATALREYLDSLPPVWPGDVRKGRAAL